MADKLRYFKIGVFGEQEVGKTSLIQAFVNADFSINCSPTNDDVREYQKLMDLSMGGKASFVALKIIDFFPNNDTGLTTERDDFKHKSYTGALDNKEKKIKKDEDIKNLLFKDKEFYGFIFVYDVNNLKTMDEMKTVIGYIEKKEKEESRKIRTKKFVVGNKTDLRKGSGWRAKTEAAIQELMKTYKVTPMECSALEHKGVNEVFRKIAEQMQGEEAFEAYEKNNDEGENKKGGAEDAGAKNKKKGKKKSGKGGISCGGRSRPDDDSSDEDEPTPAKDEDQIKELPNYGSNNKNCSIF
jgi:GTPase SAR1 family protein